MEVTDSLWRPLKGKAERKRRRYVVPVLAKKSNALICPYRDYNAYGAGRLLAFMSSTNGPVELNNQEQRTTHKMMRRFTLLTFYNVTKHPLPFPCPPQLGSIPPFFSPSLSYKSLCSFIRWCQGWNAHRGWRKRAGGLRGEERDRDRKGGWKGGDGII